MLFFPDRVANTATLLGIASTTKIQSTSVGQRPVRGFIMAGDRWGVSLDSGSGTATVIDLSTMKVHSALMLNGVPNTGSTSPDRSTLFVALGGTEWPPHGSGIDIIAGDPPKVVASLPSASGPIAVDVSKDGTRAAVASYYGKSITILEQ
jgi:hypothetical protein